MLAEKQGIGHSRLTYEVGSLIAQLAALQKPLPKPGQGSEQPVPSDRIGQSIRKPISLYVVNWMDGLALVTGLWLVVVLGSLGRQVWLGRYQKRRFSTTIGL